MTASETPANPIGSTLIALARAIERLHEILEHPAVQSAYGAAPDQVAEGGAPTVGGPGATPGSALVTRRVSPFTSAELRSKLGRGANDGDNAAVGRSQAHDRGS